MRQNKEKKKVSKDKKKAVRVVRVKARCFSESFDIELDDKLDIVKVKKEGGSLCYV